MEREIIKLNAEQHQTLCQEEYYDDDEGVTHSFTRVEKTHEGGGRHTESWGLVLQRKSDDKFFGTGYSDSVKDSMGWHECNWDDNYEAIELFPKQVMTTIYE